MSEKKFTYGLIEGFYGRPWTWKERADCVSFLTAHDYDFYIYAPKSDPYLREKWQSDWPEEFYKELEVFSNCCRAGGIRFGVGLTPFEVYDLDIDVKAGLRKKMNTINGLQPDILCILFDDIQGDNASLAMIQNDIFNYSADLSSAASFIVCPSYYTFDPILEKIFGKMPDNYMTDLGKLLDPAVDVFWTGEKVVSKDYSESHLSRVTGIFNRKPFIWDNYPVNDASWMSVFLHLRAFEGRSYQLADWTAGHSVNPMNQACLSRISMGTLKDSYALKEVYSPESSFKAAAITLCGKDLGNCIVEDISQFQDIGLEKLSQEAKAVLMKKYSAFKSPYAKEIVAWLKGEYAVQLPKMG